MESHGEQPTSKVLRSDSRGTKETQERNARMGKASGGDCQNPRGVAKERAMSFMRTLACGLRALLRKEAVDRELDEELSGFIEMASNEKIKHGMSREDALRVVRLEMGRLEPAKEGAR